MRTPRENVSRQALYCRRKRDEIFDALGRVCANCGATEELEFDVIVPERNPKSHHGCMSWTSRVAFYARQLARENLQVLCTHCNSSKRNREELQQPLPT